MSKPYWRWARYHRRRGTGKFRRAVAKPWNAAVAGLFALDQASKQVFTTQDWAWHQQPRVWLIAPAVMVAVCVTLISLGVVVIPAGLMLAGSLGNAASYFTDDRGIANPLVTQYGEGYVAFNVADLCILAAYAALLLVLARLAVRLVR